MFDTMLSSIILTHVMPWFTKVPGRNYHPMCAYDSNNPLTIGKQLTAMQRNGIAGVILTYQGPGASMPDTATEMCQQCAERGMLFALLLDPWIAKIGPGTPEQRMTAALNHPDVIKMFHSPAYLLEGYLLDFNTGVDWTKVTVPAIASGPRPVLGLGTGFTWSHDAGDVDPIVALRNAYAQHPIKIGSLCMSFFDGGAPLPPPLDRSKPFDPVNAVNVDFQKQNWGTGGSTRYTPDRAGNYFFDQLAITPATLKYVAIETWNDYNERTCVEPWMSVVAGIRIS